MITNIFINRELSWLSFNYRVLQEAKDPAVPLFERIKFLAIYSSNLDEFYRVRVAGLRSLLRLKKNSVKTLKFNPEALIMDIQEITFNQQEEFGHIYKNSILPELQKYGIRFVDDKNADDEQSEFIRNYFETNIAGKISVIQPLTKDEIPFLKNRSLYFAVKLLPARMKYLNMIKENYTYALVEIPSDRLPRFVELPQRDNKHAIIFLDDILRFNFPLIFPDYHVTEAYSIKLTRDAELPIDDEFSGNLLEKIKKGLKKRNGGIPSRFLYDKSMPKDFLKYLRESLDLEKEDLSAGARYHNFSDFFAFPNPSNIIPTDEPMPPLWHKDFSRGENIFDVIKSKDVLLHFPYHTYDHVIEFLEAAAEDENVKSIKITQYRVAKKSAVVNALIKAAHNGKKVTSFVELKARFDEESNIHWAEEMEKAGVTVHYSFPGLKVHSKLAMVERIENNEIARYCYFGTGNFNEKTALIYSDIGLLTHDERLTSEAEMAFQIFERKRTYYPFKHLLVAQFNMRRIFLELIDEAIEAAEDGEQPRLIIKLNSLQERKIIRKLVQASQAGVDIKMIIRGICCLAPGIPGKSDNIEIISVVDRFLEHSRVYIFDNGEEEKIYCGSADWMNRNLRRRIEVVFPIYDNKLKREIKDIINIQLNDNIKARIIDKNNLNEYVKRTEGPKIRSQIETYNYLKNK